MAIQIPNPGTGNGASGDNEFVLWSKVKDNFSDQTNAASRLVGNAAGNVPQIVGNAGVGGFGLGATANLDIISASTLPEFKAEIEKKGTGFYRINISGLGESSPVINASSPAMLMRNSNAFTTLQASYSGNGIRVSVGLSTSELFYTYNLYTDRNTTKEPTTGYLKAASPILHLFNDDLVKEHEAVEQDITVEKLGTGDYLIKDSSGLSSEGWNLSPPKDIHGNVLCMVEATEADGNINVKTYKRKFDFDIVAIVPDYDQPFDIPDGHSVDLRLNDLPIESLDDTRSEEAGLEK